MSAAESPVFDVIVVGYGPVGQTLAAALGRCGRRVAVIERWPELFGRARAGHVDHEVMRILQSVGAAEALEADAHLADTYEFVNGDGQRLMSFDYGAPGISGWRSDYIFYQPVLETALDVSARACPTVEVHQGWEAVGVEEREDEVHVTARRVARDAGGVRALSGPAQALRGRYLVAADGANSSVRSWLGIDWNDLGFRSTWLVIDLVPTGPMEFAFDNGQVCDPVRPHCLFQLGNSHRRFEFAKLPGEDAESLADPAVAWELMAQYDVTPANARIERQAVYTFGSCVADRWRSGRSVLIGDAAHLMPPFMGQGMCSGIRDAMGLAWRLDLVLGGRATDGLLDSFEAERSAHAQTLVEMSIAAGELACTFDPEVAAARDRSFRDGTVPPPPSFPILRSGLLAGADDPLAGRLAPQFRARAGNRTGRFDDVVGRGWMLLSTQPVDEAITDAGREVLRRLGALAVVADEVLDIDGDYRRFLEAEGMVAILYRPDFYIFGCARAADDVPGLVDRLAAQVPADTGTIVPASG